MERTIRVTGKGKLAVKPDLIELTLSIKDIKKEYDELLKRSSSATNEVKELLEKIDFERKNIKTKSFDINIEYDSYRDKNDKQIEEFKGYSFIHKMKIEFEKIYNSDDIKTETNNITVTLKRKIELGIYQEIKMK